MTLLEHLRDLARQSPETISIDLSRYCLVQLKRGIATATGLAFEPGDFALVDDTVADGQHSAFSFRTRSFTVIANKSFTVLPENTPRPGYPLEVRLANQGNPDFRQDPSQPLPGTESGLWVPVADFAEASAVCRAYIDENSLGSGNWTGGLIRDAATRCPAGWVSYNGKVWADQDFDADREPVYDPSGGAVAPTA